MENSEAGTESFSDKLSVSSFEVDFRAVRVSLLGFAVLMFDVGAGPLLSL